jgi:hypothetical protein
MYPFRARIPPAGVKLELGGAPHQKIRFTFAHALAMICAGIAREKRLAGRNMVTGKAATGSKGGNNAIRYRKDEKKRSRPFGDRSVELRFAFCLQQNVYGGGELAEGHRQRAAKVGFADLGPSVTANAAALSG